MNQGKEQDLSRVERQAVEGVHGGMMLHIHATRNLLNGNDLTSNEKGTLRDAGSNAINHLYVWRWKDMSSTRHGIYPQIVSPSSDLHLALIAETRAEYDSLENQRMRVYLAGDKGLEAASPTSPISPDESPFYLSEAQERGIISGYSKSTPLMPIDEDIVRFFMTIQQHGLSFNRKRLNEHLDILFTERFRPDLKTAAIHKLGTYMALVEQRAFEGNALGSPILKDYIPSVLQGTEGFWESEKTYFDGRTPNLDEIYQMAQTILKDQMPDDKWVHHLLNLPSSLV